MAAVVPMVSAGVGIFGAIAGAGAESRQLKGQARMARMQADESDTVYREDMLRQLSNIQAIRSSAGMSTDTPTFQAIVADERATAGANRQRKVRGHNMQASQYDADASMVKRLGWLRAMGLGISGLDESLSRARQAGSM